MLVGTPGILLAFILPLLIRDPRRCADSPHFNTADTPVKAKLSIKDAVREVNPLANSAAGTTTVIAPYIQDSQIEPLANQNATAVAKTSATSTCAANTRQTENAG